MNKTLLALTIAFGMLFVAGLVWFIISASTRSISDPTPGPSQLFDSDQDGLTDAKEKETGTDPTESDSDYDGLNDKQEIEEYLTNPLQSDTDGDGFIDGVEVRGGYDPLGPN